MRKKKKFRLFWKCYLQNVFTNHIYIYIYIYEQDLALNNLQWLICHKTKPNLTKQCTFIFFLSRGIILWIEISRLENPANTCAWLDCFFGLIRSHQSILWSRPLGIEPATTEPKHNHWAHNPHCTQVIPNQLVMVIARPINLNVSCKLHPYSLQRTRPIHNIIPLLKKKETVHLYPCPWGYNNYADEYF